jgi:Protein of unknown function (DUF2569)
MKFSMGDVYFLILVSSLIAPPLIVLIWAHRINKAAHPHRPCGFGGGLLIFILYLVFFRLIVSFLRMLIYFATNSTDLRSPKFSLGLAGDGAANFMILCIIVISIILFFKKSMYFPVFYWYSTWVCIALLFIDLVFALLSINLPLSFIRIVLKLFFTDPKNLAGNLLLPIASAFYIRRSVRVRNTFHPPLLPLTPKDSSTTP